MQGTNLFARLSTKFVIITVILLILSGGIGFFVGKENLNSLIDLNRVAESTAEEEESLLQRHLGESLDHQEKLDVALAEKSNAATLLEKRSEIDRRKALLQGASKGALLIVSSQIESILYPQPQDERDFFEVNDEVYLEVLKDAQEINYVPAYSDETLADYVAEYEVGDVRAKDLATALAERATPDEPYVHTDRDAGIIRFLNILGTLEEPFGLLEIIMTDSVTPLDDAAKQLEADFAAQLAARKKELHDAFQKRKDTLKAEEEHATAKRNERVAEANAVGDRAKRSHGIIVVLSTLFAAVVIGLVVVFLITRPISEGIATMGRVAEGDTEADVTGTHRKDEIGLLARNILQFKQSVIDRQMMEAEREAEQQRRSEERAVEEKAVEEKIGNGVETAVGEIGGQLSEVNTISAELDGSASRTRSRAEEVASATGEANRLVHSIADATVGLTDEIGLITNQVSQATQISQEAAHMAEEAHGTVNDLDRAAESVGEVVSLINDIAEQTNLLALNATIEAARAGDAGKGFAVVASEVKALADQTARATGEISEHVVGIQTVSKSAAGAIGAISGKVAEVETATSSIIEAVDRQREMTQKISEMSHDSTDRMENVDALINEVEEMASRTGDLSADLKTRGGKVSDTIDHLGTKLGHDVRTIFAELGGH